MANASDDGFDASPTAHPQPSPPPLMPICAEIWRQSPETWQLAMPSVVTAHTQHGPGQLTVLHGSASHMPVSGMQRRPFPHWVTAQVSTRHWPVAWSQNWPPAQGVVAQLSLMQAPPTQRCELEHLLTVHRSTQLPLSQYWLLPQLTPMHLSVWHMPALHIWPAAQPSV